MKEGDPFDEIIKVVKEENIDLLIMLAHEEGHIEHFLFGRDNEDLIRKMPCSIILVKKEPHKVSVMQGFPAPALENKEART